MPKLHIATWLKDSDRLYLNEDGTLQWGSSKTVFNTEVLWMTKDTIPMWRLNLIPEKGFEWILK